MPAQSNFAFIEAEWPQIYASCLRAEEYISSDPRSACFYARHSIEQLIERIYQLRGLRDPYRDDLAARVHDQQFREISTQGIIQKLDLIRKVGNKAVHGDQTPRPDVAHHVVRDLHHVLIWAAQHFSTAPDTVPVTAAFDPQLAARRQPMRVDELRQLAVTVQKEQEDYRRQLEESEAKTRALEEELATVRAQVAEAQRAKQVRDTRDYDEAATRTRYIDLDLSEAGWTLTTPGDGRTPPNHAETEVRLTHPHTGQTLYADYVLWGDDGRPLAVVEAKRTSRNAEAGQEQARLYADALEAEHPQRPLIFYTNGSTTWLWDDASGYPPREVRGFLRKEELAWRLQSRRRRRPLPETPINADIVERDYQTHAIRTVGESFTDRQRAALLVMATGTGKTRTVIALVDQMLRAGWVKRVLFLADRTALVRQAVNAFKEHLPQEPPVNLVEEKDQDARIFVSTYPTMLNRIREYTEKQTGPFSPGYFDLVIVDEAHRSVYQKYRSIFDWFDSLLLGLTATPVDQVDKNTYLLFEQEPGVPTDAYSLEEAIDDGYLVPPRTLTLGTRFLDRGISYDELSEEDKLAWDALEWDEDGEIPDAVTSAEMNQRLFNEDTVDKVLTELMTHGITVAGGDRLGKTIIFAKNQQHADFIYQRFNRQYPLYGGTFARVITHQVEHAQDLIDSFSVPEAEPHIAITVDMLDTGIDVPEAVNLLFFKPVYSKTKFWQMVGRGTRTRRDLFGPGQDKTEFLILDVCGNVEFFNADLPEREAARPQSLSERLFRHRVELLTTLRHGTGRSPTGNGTLGRPDLGHAVVDAVEYRADHLHADIAHAARHHVLGMNPHNVQVRPHRQLVETYSSSEAWERLDPAEAEHVAATLGRLPTGAQRDKEEAKTFDLTVLRAQLAQLLGDSSAFQTQQHRIQDIATNLLTKVNVPTVKAQARLLEELADDTWWQDTSALMLEDVRRRLRDLIVYVDKRTWKPVHTTFTDELIEAREVDLARTTPGTDMRRFKDKATRFLESQMDTLALQKLRHNRQLTSQDLAALEEMLLESGAGTRADIQAAAEEAQGLGLFVRSLVGLDRTAVQASFNEFIAGSTFSAQQLRFIDQVIAYLTANGAMTVEALYESPLSDNGDPDSVIGDDRVDVVIDIIEKIRRRATPSESEATQFESPGPDATDRIAT